MSIDQLDLILYDMYHMDAWLDVYKRQVYEIAERVGYSDTASFYRVFKEELGVSPARYKRNLPN